MVKTVGELTLCRGLHLAWEHFCAVEVPEHGPGCSQRAGGSRHHSRLSECVSARHGEILVL